MKKLLRLTGIVSAMAALALMSACQTAGTSQAASQNEALLTQSGFKTIAVTTPKQQQAVSKLPQGTVSAVKHQGKTHVNAAKKAVAAQQAQPAQNSMNPPPTMTFQGHGPHQVVAEEFDGFGPMGTASLGDW
jgi:long-subunit acyl-CoA synthetase (AMP-forming)